MNTLFPIYLKLDQIRTLLVGGGPVGLEKLEAIFYNSPQAKVTAVATEATLEFRQFVQGRETVDLYERPFQDGDLTGIDIVILATNNPEFNEYVRQLTSARNILLNVADKPDLCDFYLGSVVRKGNLKIGISTNGKSPTIAKRIKEFLNDVLPEEIDETLELMQQMRNSIQGDFKTKVKVLNEHTKSLIS